MYNPRPSDSFDLTDERPPSQDSGYGGSPRNTQEDIASGCHRSASLRRKLLEINAKDATFGSDRRVAILVSTQSLLKHFIYKIKETLKLQLPNLLLQFKRFK